MRGGERLRRGEQYTYTSARAQSTPPHYSNLQSLEDFGRDRLSPREAEILQMVLKGHSNRSISLTLGITIPTVKTHRKNAYVKLGIATQQELFFCFLKWTERT